MQAKTTKEVLFKVMDMLDKSREQVRTMRKKIYNAELVEALSLQSPILHAPPTLKVILKLQKLVHLRKILDLPVFLHLCRLILVRPIDRSNKIVPVLLIG